jgi:hypothetical protein
MALLKAWIIAVVLLSASLIVGVDAVDPAGDQWGAWAAFDLLEYSTSFSPGTLTVTLTMDPANASDIDFLTAYVDFDTDQDPETGWASHLEAFGLDPLPSFGMDYYIEVGGGWASLVRTTGEVEDPVGEPSPISVDGSTVTFSVPRCHAPGCDGIYMGAGFDSVILIGNGTPTDRAPNDASVIRAEPGRGDLDEDGDVDEDDAAMLGSCMTGSQGGPVAGACGAADLDSDQDVDQTDFGLLQRLMTGPF